MVLRIAHKSGSFLEAFRRESIFLHGKPCRPGLMVLAATVLGLVSGSQAVEIDGYLQATPTSIVKKSAPDALLESLSVDGSTASVNITASTVSTPISYEFRADGEASTSGMAGSGAKAKVGCEIDPAGYWSYVTRNIDGFRVNNPYVGLKKFVFKEPMRFTCSFSVSGGFPPLGKGLIQAETGKLTWRRADGTTSQETGFGSQPLELITGGEPNGYSEGCQGTVGPGTYYIGAAAVWVAYGSAGSTRCKGEVSFRVNFTHEQVTAGKVEAFRGDCEVRRDGAKLSLGIGDSVRVGDLVRTGSSSFVKIVFPDGSRLTMGQESSIKVEKFSRKAPSVISLIKGSLRAKVKKDLDSLNPDSRSKYFIRTRQSVIGVRGTEFEVTYSERDGEGMSRVEVIEGIVEMIDFRSGEVTRVQGGQRKALTGPVNKSAPVLVPEIAVYDLDATELVSGVASTNFGSAEAGVGKVERYFRIRNIWTADLKDIVVSLEGEQADDFRVIGPGVDLLQGGASAEFAVKFKPSAMGLRRATLKITSNDADENPFMVLMEGNGTAPGPEIDVMQPRGSHLIDGTSRRSFGTVEVGRTGSSRTFSIRNTGTTDLSGIQVSLDGRHAADFTVSMPNANSLGPGATTKVVVGFKPTIHGTRRAVLRVTSNDADEPSFEVFLSGTGAD